MSQNYFVYILASKPYGTIYIGVTNNLLKRTYQHKQHLVEGFTKAYSVDKLVYFEIYTKPALAIQLEKKLKSWNRGWKIALIEKENPYWEDLYLSLVKDNH